jgi:hypothetical protein
MKIHLYIRKYENDGKETIRVKRVELELDGMVVKLPPEYVDLKKKILYNPISNLLIPLHPDITVYHVKK